MVLPRRGLEHSVERGSAVTTKLPEPHRDWRGHDFWPPADVLAEIPPYNSTQHMPSWNTFVYVHYFVGACDWWVTELDRAELVAFGYVCLGDPSMAEWGSIDLVDLAEVFQPPSFGKPVPGG